VKQPLRHQSFGELALRVFIVEKRPMVAGVERLLQAFLLKFCNGATQVARTRAPVKPKPGSYCESAAAAFAIPCQHKLHGMHQVRVFAEQSSSRTQALADQIDLAVLQVPQSAMNNAGRPAGRA